MEQMLKEILSEIKGLKDGQMQTNNRLDRIESTMATKEELAKVSQSQSRMEYEITDKVQALFDAREVQFDVNDRIVESLARIESKLDRITLKVATHDSIIQRVK